MQSNKSLLQDLIKQQADQELDDIDEEDR